MSKVFADFFTSYKICKVLCTITEFTWKDIARMNQNHEDGIKRQQILVGMFFLGKTYLVHNFGTINSNLDEMLYKHFY